MSGGPITSPNYPYPYPAGVKECWLFTTPNKTHIEFYFPTFKTPVSQAELTVTSLTFNSESLITYFTSYDGFQIYDGPTAQSNILRQFTGDIYPEIFFSTTNRALMTFTSVTEGGPSSPTGFEGYYASVRVCFFCIPFTLLLIWFYKRSSTWPKSNRMPLGETSIWLVFLIRAAG